MMLSATIIRAKMPNGLCDACLMISGRVLIAVVEGCTTPDTIVRMPLDRLALLGESYHGLSSFYLGQNIRPARCPTHEPHFKRDS